MRKDINNNILYVAHGYDPQTAYRQEFRIAGFHYLTISELPEKICFKIRHTPEYLKGQLKDNGDGTMTLLAEQPIHGVAPGQFCVVYDERHHRCYGSGEITL